jgi:hypothetical protein
MMHCTHSRSWWKRIVLLEIKLINKRIIYLYNILVVGIRNYVQNYYYLLVDKDYFQMMLIYDEQEDGDVVVVFVDEQKQMD